MYITKELAFRIESCIKQSHIEVTGQYAHGQILRVNGGVACFSGFDSYLSQVVGWGFSTTAKQFHSEIEQIELFYKSLKHTRVDIELCPFVGNELACLLSKRGYMLSELNNISVLDLTSYEAQELELNDVEIRQVERQELQDWAKGVAYGFEYPEAQEQFVHYASAKGIVAFGAYQDGKLIAGSTVAMHGDVCDLGVTSTHIAHRGKGLQKKLIITRLNYAQKHGMRLATVTTEPGSISDLNIQKIGFQCAYSRVKMTLMLDSLKS